MVGALGEGMTTGSDLCALMATYRGETAQNLEMSLASIANQTEPVGRIVMVVDGPIDAEQEEVLTRMSATLPLHLVRLEKSGGLARALNAGLPQCDRAFVMRADTDDFCMPDRVAVQLAYLRDHPKTDFLSSWAREVFSDGGKPQVKTSPTEHDDVVRALRWRNVIVHASVIVRTSSLRAVGGYRHEFGMLEDYDLFVRLAQSGAKFHVIPRILVQTTSNAAQKERRGGIVYLFKEMAFRRNLLRSGFVGRGEFFLSAAIYGVFRAISGPFRRRLYALVRL